MKNLKIVYWLSFLQSAWFWIGIWVLFYLRFTNYAGIGLLESVMILTITMAEIPTGAVADLLGKKKTLMISFFLLALGNIWMALSAGIISLAIAIFIMCVGGAFYSGTAEALVYDSLVEEKREDFYVKAVANMKTSQLLAIAVAGVSGGLMYRVWPGLPFMAVAAAALIGLILTFFLQEPKVDTEKFSWPNFKRQTRQGAGQLFKSPAIKKQTISLLIIGFFTLIVYEFLDDVLLVEFGFSPVLLGAIYTVIHLVSAVVSQSTPWVERKFGIDMGVIILGLGIGLTLVVSPLLGMVVGGISVIIRASLQVVYEGLTSLAINRNTESRYRATTISTFNMIKSVPYVLTAYLIGSMVDSLTAAKMAMYFGVGLMFFQVVYVFAKAGRNRLRRTAD